MTKPRLMMLSILEAFLMEKANNGSACSQLGGNTL